MASIKRDTHDIYPYISATGRLSGAAEGKVIVVTGGGKGIGKAIARQFALAEASHVFIIGREQAVLDTTAAEIENEKLGSKVTVFAGDVTRDSMATEFLDSLKSSGITADVLINNAGANNSATLVADSDPLEWWRDWELNLKGTYLMTRAFISHLAGKPGVIINVSTSIVDMVLPNMSAYGGSKAAVNRLTETVQLEYGSRGIRCLCLHPGGIQSTGVGQNAPAQFRGTLLDTVDLAAGTVLYLSTPEASYLDGRMVLADWDMELVQQCTEEIMKDSLLVSRINWGTRLKPWEIVGLPRGLKLSN